MMVAWGLPAVVAHSNSATPAPGVGGDGTIVVDDQGTPPVQAVDPNDPGFLAPRPATDGVSGTFVSPAGPLVDDSGGELGLIAAGMAICDFEVLSTGGNGALGAHSPQDESTVDADDGSGEPLPPPGTGGLVPNGLWDDGGYGGACHTDASAYEHDGYNTPGCTGDTVTADSPARASAQVAGVGVDITIWIGAACDAVTTHADGVGTCIVNSILQFDVGDPEGSAQRTQDCVNNLTPGSNPGTFVFCGADSSSDLVNFGTADPTSGPQFPTLNDVNTLFGSSCVQDDASEVAFVFTGAAADTSGATISPPFVGWVNAV